MATRLVLRLGMLDEDETLKDLAMIKTIEELWFPPLPLASALKARTRTTAQQIIRKTKLSFVQSCRDHGHVC